MQKNILLFLFLFFIAIFLSGCIDQQSVCGDGICEEIERDPNSVFYCPQDCIFECPDIWYPVCGVDGKTYLNYCYADQVGVKIDYYGECEIINGPVCGDGICEEIEKDLNSEYYCPGDCDDVCVENWDCGVWRACSNDFETRVCFDLNNCNTTNNKPVTQRACTGCANDIIIFVEEERNKYLVNPGECDSDGWCSDDFIDFSKQYFINDFYKYYADKFDFLIVIPQITGFRSHFNSSVNSFVEGIGRDVYYNQEYDVLQSVALVELHRRYDCGENYGGVGEIDNTFLNVIFHEIVHQWCCYIDGVVEPAQHCELPAHWVNNLDLFSGDSSKIDIMGYYHWIKKDGKMICIEQDEADWRFSDLTLYLAGLLPPEEVSPIYLHKFEKTDNEFYNLWGPSCSSNPKFLETKVITIEDIIRINGERIPSYDSSKKDFNVGIVVLVPHGSEIDYDFVNYVNKYKQAIPEGWQIATNNKSTMTVCS